MLSIVALPGAYHTLPFSEGTNGRLDCAREFHRFPAIIDDPKEAFKTEETKEDQFLSPHDSDGLPLSAPE